jgi:P-type E1-E2 ATPase
VRRNVQDRRLVGARIAHYDYGSRALARDASHFSARGALDALAALLPDAAERVNGAEVQAISLVDLHVSDVVLVRPGTRVPAAGVVVEGTADVDESMITGESRAVLKGHARL